MEGCNLVALFQGQVPIVNVQLHLPVKRCRLRHLGPLKFKRIALRGSIHPPCQAEDVMDNSTSPCIECREKIFALGITVLMHVAIAFAIISFERTRGHFADASGEDGNLVAYVDFMAAGETTASLEPARKIETPTSSNATVAKSAAQPTSSVSSERVYKEPSAETDINLRARSSTEEASARNAASAAAAIAAQGAVQEGSQSSATEKDEDLRSRYIAAVRDAIWRQLSEEAAAAEPLVHCSLRIEQSIGGSVTSVELSKCDARTSAVIEAAVIAAQPLPYAGFEGVYTMRLDLEM